MARAHLRRVPYMGVIHVVAEAMKLGFVNGHPDWCNLGQGQPEVGEMEGAPPRLGRIDLRPSDHAYGPVNGIDELRACIAEHVNRLYRAGRSSRYTAANVSVACGGRLALSRIFAALDATRIGYQTPDYTAYEDMLQAHAPRLVPVHLPTRAEDGFVIPPAALERAVVERELGAFLLSNPCNPTGQVIQGEALGRMVDVARRHDCALVLDEFYSHFVYGPDGGPAAGPVSAAAYVEDVDRDPVFLVDGLTKSFRYPGWRLGWVVGPAAWIDVLGRVASALDGGPSVPVQRAALEVLEPGRADQETAALRRVFARKRALVLEALAAMGVRCDRPGAGTFYVWASLEGLPGGLSDGDAFFRRALERRVMTVPGRFFDVNPGGLRPAPSPWASWTRFSFGPPAENVAMGLDRLAGMVRAAG
jgi:aspartate/methionine/tyrosine aminotransferase